MLLLQYVYMKSTVCLEINIISLNLFKEMLWHAG